VRGTSALLAATFVLALGLAGCGGNDGTADAGPTLVDQCLSSSDQTIIQSALPDGGAQPGELVGILGILEGCGRGPCLDEIISGSEQDVKACYDTCLDATEAADLSAMCRLCYYEAVACGQQFCSVICLGADPVGCEQCLQDGCYPALDTCTGL